MLRTLLIAAVLTTGAASSFAADTVQNWTKLREGHRYRLDVDIVQDHLRPNDVYGDWTTATATLYIKHLPRVTPFVQVGLLEREDANAGLTLGTYADWTSRLYTYTAFARGGESHYQPKLRWDHSFNFNTGPVILVFGGGQREDFDGHDDWNINFGPRVWRGPIIAEYRATRTHSDPGDLVSWKHTLTFGWGEEGRVWLFVNATSGREYYTATWVAPTQVVDHDFREITVSWQRWMSPRFRIKLQAGWLDLGEGIDGYEKVGAGAGFFWEF